MSRVRIPSLAPFFLRNPKIPQFLQRFCTKAFCAKPLFQIAFPVCPTPRIPHLIARTRYPSLASFLPGNSRCSGFLQQFCCTIFEPPVRFLASRNYKVSLRGSDGGFLLARLLIEDPQRCKLIFHLLKSRQDRLAILGNRVLVN